MGSFLSATFIKSFMSTVNMFILQFMIQIFDSQIFSNIGRNCFVENRKKIAFLMGTLTCRSTILYAPQKCLVRLCLVPLPKSFKGMAYA
jgi:hypothetical protein